MSKSPAFQFYPKDFLADLNVAVMTMEERGIYITLLCHCWLENGIPIGSPLVKGWLKDGSAIRNCFYKKGNKFRHKRLDQEKQKQREWSEKSAEGGRRGAKTRWGDPSRKDKGGITTVKAKHDSSSSSSSSSTKKHKNKEPRKLETCDTRLTALLIRGILANDEKAKVPKEGTLEFDKWADQVRLCRERDGRGEDEIEAAILFSQNDSFWIPNIHSTTKLRKQLPTLLQQAKRGDSDEYKPDTQVGGTVKCHHCNQVVLRDKRCQACGEEL